MSNKLQKVINALNDCEGEMIPYPTVKKMLQVKDELQAVINENAEPAVQADAEELACLCDFKSKIIA